MKMLGLVVKLCRPCLVVIVKQIPKQIVLHFQVLAHHIVSCAIVPAIGLNMPFARVVDVSNLGMCGIPGGIDYLLLALQKSENKKFMFYKINLYYVPEGI